MKTDAQQTSKFLVTLEKRFRDNLSRHKNVDWGEVKRKLLSTPSKLVSIHEMEKTQGEPDLIKIGGSLAYVDCSLESPKARRSLCFDAEALNSRKTFKPKNSAINMAEEMGIELLGEEEYKELQKFGEFDTKTSSWIKTPAKIRKLGGALFADRRFGHVFVYHNGAESYYASRGFRGLVRI